MFLGTNIRFLRNKNGRTSQTDLANELGLTRSALSSYEDGRAEPKLEVLINIANYFNLGIDELLKIDLRESELESHRERLSIKEHQTGSSLRVLTITLDENGEENVELVPQKAAAGYTAGFSDAEYISELPKFKVPFLSDHKTYRAFEITGESMLPLQPGAIVVAEYIEDWSTIKDGEICIVVSSTEGIVLKQCYTGSSADRLLLKSTNLDYQPYELPVKEIIEIWRFTGYYSKNFPEQIEQQDGWKSAFTRLEDEVLALKRKFEGPTGL
jgi:transcriptional regulator with XRE-family HTH domain